MAVQQHAGTFLNPPQVIGVDHPLYQPPSSRKFEGIPSLAVSSGERLWSTRYAGPTPGEDRNNYVVLATSGDHGTTWTERFIVDPDGDGPIRADARSCSGHSTLPPTASIPMPASGLWLTRTPTDRMRLGPPLAA